MRDENGFSSFLYFQNFPILTWFRKLSYSFAAFHVEIKFENTLLENNKNSTIATLDQINNPILVKYDE